MSLLGGGERHHADACAGHLQDFPYGEKMYETLLTNEECAHSIDLGNFYRVPADQRDLNYDKYFKVGDETRSSVKEFDSSNTKLMSVVEVKDKLLSLQYIQDELARE